MSDPKGTEPPRSPLQVLLVEDERGSAVYLEGLLQDVAPGQFELSWAPTLSAGFDQLHARRFDAILLDLSLPDSSGLETVRRMTGTGIGIPIVVITGHADERVAVEALRAGAQDYLVKDDASGRTVARAIRHAIERKQSEEALRRARDELERRVQDRTAELSRAIADLREEVVRRGEAEGELRERTEQLRLLASQVTLAEHRERQRLALLIHDGLQQLLVGATYRLGRLERAPSAEVRQAAEEVGALISDAIGASRSLTAELGPPILLRSGGLGPALEWLARWMRDRHGLEVHVNADPAAEPGAEDLTIILFQATRELLFNVVKHAGVKVADVELALQRGEVHVTVRDAGSGFDPSIMNRGASRDGGFGLFSIRERLEVLGGRLEVESSGIPGEGARFTIWLPKEAQEPEHGPGSKKPRRKTPGLDEIQPRP